MKFIRFWTVLCVLAGILVFASFEWAFVIFTDDPFISFRYARNMLEGHGLVFNPGQRVEGYTNFLWTVLLAAGMYAGFDPVPLSQWLGLTASLTSLVIVAMVSRRLYSGMIIPPTCGLILITNRDFLRWGTGGLETPLFTVLILGAVAASIFASDRRSRWLAGILGAAAAMTRPEGIILGLLMTLMNPSIRKDFRAAIDVLSAFAIVYCPYFLWRLVYYGQICPNTFYAKINGSMIETSLQGLVYTGGYLKHVGEIPLIGMLILAWLAMRRRPEFLFIWTILVLSLVCVVEGGDWMPNYRFFVPMLPLIALATGAAIDGLLTGKTILWRSGPLIHRTIAFLVPVSLILTPHLVQPTGFLHPVFRKIAQAARAEKKAGTSIPGIGRIGRSLSVRQGGEEHWIDTDKALAFWLKRTAPENATMALGRIGVIPYYSGLRTIDFFGLTEPAIARGSARSCFLLSGHQKLDVSYILDRCPDYIIFPGKGSGSGQETAPYWARVLRFNQDRRFVEEYEQVRVEAMESGHQVYRRNCR